MESSKLTAQASIQINAPASEVWKALVTPELISKYLFGTKVSTDWKVGSAITYSGEWQGTKYQDKGVIKKLDQGRLLQTTYWSLMSGTEDLPENYSTVTYSIEENGEECTLTITQDNCKDDESRAHSEKNWNMVLGTLKELVESEAKANS